MGIAAFVGALVWASLSGQFAFQIFTSLIVTATFASGLLFSRANKHDCLLGFVVSLASAIVFGALLVGGGWLAARYLEFQWWDLTAVSFAVVFAATIVFSLLQLPGKFLLAFMCAWEPGFAENSMLIPRSERVDFAFSQWRQRNLPAPVASPYQVIWSDGLAQDTRLTNEEIDYWARASNADPEKKHPHVIVRIDDEEGKTVWPVEVS
jgi:hypothetical protein